MEANFFRFLVQDERFHLIGRRVEKIYAPLEHVWTLKLGSKCHLVCVAGKRHHAVFLSAHKPSNPHQPPAFLGWWRKRIQGRRVVDCRSDWPSRRLALRLDHNQGQWLVIDVQSGLSLVDDLKPDFGHQPEWPSWDLIHDHPQIYKRYPQITPPLRHTLSALDPNQGRQLLNFLQSSYSPGIVSWAHTLSEKEQDWLVPWAIPDSLDHRFSRVLAYTDPLQAAEEYGFSMVEGLGSALSETGVRLGREKKRLSRQLAKIAEDEQRLQEMAARREQAELIKANLYQLNGEARLNRLELSDAYGRSRTLSLDSRISVRENMERLFKQARKGRRGLEHVARRRGETEKSLEALEEGGASSDQEGPGYTMPSAPASRVRPEGKPPSGHKDILMYASSDGFSILRGKNNRANHRLVTRVARPHDLWFHAAHGPGAHVLVRRPGPTSDVPATTRREAAGIAALRSHFSGSAKAEIICAQVKHVSPIKGGSPGQVKVSQVMESLQVPLEADLEDRLIIK